MNRVEYLYRISNINLGQMVEELAVVPNMVVDGAALYQARHDGVETLSVVCTDQVNEPDIAAVVAAHVPDPNFGELPTLAEWLALPEADRWREVYDLLYSAPPDP